MRWNSLGNVAKIFPVRDTGPHKNTSSIPKKLKLNSRKRNLTTEIQTLRKTRRKGKEKREQKLEDKRPKRSTTRATFPIEASPNRQQDSSTASQTGSHSR